MLKFLGLLFCVLDMTLAGVIESMFDLEDVMKLEKADGANFELNVECMIV